MLFWLVWHSSSTSRIIPKKIIPKNKKCDVGPLHTETVSLKGSFNHKSRRHKQSLIAPAQDDFN
jgi:hypothetical protein